MKPITEHPYAESLLTSKSYFWNCRTPEELHAYYAKLKTRKEDDREQLLAIAQNERKLLVMIRSTCLTMEGWTSDLKISIMAAITMATKPKLFVEIGVFAGRSLLPVAMTAKGLNLPTKIIGIDPYSPHESVKNETPENSKWWASVDHNNILEKLTTNLKNHNVTDMVTIIRKTSDEATAPDNIDFLHVDGNHMDQSIKDVQKYAPKIPIGGIVMCDDLHWATGCVLRAVDALEEMGFVEAFRCEDWNVMQRVK